jgi:hypothetical protein
MLKLVLGVVVETIVGVSLAGLSLAIVVPVLNHYRSVRAGDVMSMGVIAGVIVCVTALVLVRPGSAINRWRRR